MPNPNVVAYKPLLVERGRGHQIWSPKNLGVAPRIPGAEEVWSAGGIVMSSISCWMCCADCDVIEMLCVVSVL